LRPELLGFPKGLRGGRTVADVISISPGGASEFHDLHLVSARRGLFDVLSPSKRRDPTWSYS
jgi:hypothetical protein